ncbi:hypothetical protein Tco_0417811 [Tanacetum coccineum]
MLPHRLPTSLFVASNLSIATVHEVSLFKRVDAYSLIKILDKLAVFGLNKIQLNQIMILWYRDPEKLELELERCELLSTVKDLEIKGHTHKCGSISVEEITSFIKGAVCDAQCLGRCMYMHISCFRSPNISFMRPFGCPLTILNTLDQLEREKGKGPDWMFDLELLTSSMNYIPVRKENYVDSKEQGISCDDDEDLDNTHSEERTADKEVPLSSEDQALHDELVSLMHQESIAKVQKAFSDSDYAGDNHDRRSTSGGCQYLGRRLVSWQCKKQTIVAISSTEAEYVAAASCCAQVLWMQNQLLDYGFNFMNTEIHIDNESTICIVKNPVLHSKTKHIQIRHHFIRDCYEQRLINVVKVHTDDNVADLLTKGFDLARFNFLVVTIERIFGSSIVTFTGRICMDISRAASSPRDAQGTPAQSAAQASILQDTA